MTRSTGYLIDTLKLGPMENFVYLIQDVVTGRTALVDPAWEADKIITHAQAKGLHITDILLTHSHYDHVNAIADVLRVFDAKVHLLKPEAQFWGHYEDLPTLHHGGDEIALGKTAIRVLHTPGHTPGSACYHVGDDLIAGDTLFVFGCGRCDLAGGDPNQMFDTLNRLRTELPADTRLLPGHDYADRPTSTMQEQIEGNPFFHFDERAAFVHYRTHDHDRTRSPPLTPMKKA